jgi:PAS domain S-box-containing protein
MRDEGQGLSHQTSHADVVAALEHLHAEADLRRRENEHLLEANRTLEEQRDFYQRAYDDSPTASLVLDGQGMVHACNAAATALLGLTAPELVGRALEPFLDATDHPLFVRHLERCARESGVVASVLTLRRRDRAAVPVELWSARFAHDEDFYSSVIVDISERLAANVERTSLRDSERAARAESEAKEQFIATLSHELRTPLTPVLAAVTALAARDQMPAPMRGLLEMIRRNVAAEARLIDDLLDAARIRRGKLRLDCQPTDVHESVQQAVDTLAEEAGRKRLTMEVALEAPAHHASADPLRLRQVFWNLLGNAIKFTPEGGRVCVRSWNRGAVLAVEVGDSGTGLSDDMLRRLFRPFEQGPEDGRRAGGLGLGLAISRGLMELHGGRIQASSEGPGAGARFLVEIDTIPAPEARSPPAAAVAAPVEHRRRILLVEDHADTATSLAELLRDEGYQVETATTAAAALAVDLEKVDLVVSDLGLPDASGHDLMRELRTRRPLPAIALSGYGTEADKRASEAAGFDVHLTKPVDWSELLAAIERVGGAVARSP